MPHDFFHFANIYRYIMENKEKFRPDSQLRLMDQACQAMCFKLVSSPAPWLWVRFFVFRGKSLVGSLISLDPFAQAGMSATNFLNA